MPHNMTDNETPRRKRRRVALEDRKRVSVACCNCRRLKEKCNGEIPCERCVKRDRTCSRQTLDDASTTDSEGDGERIRLLEAVACHFLGDRPLDVLSLRGVVNGFSVDDLKDGHGTNSQPTPDSTGLSCNAFTGEVKRATVVATNSGFVSQLRNHVELRLGSSIPIPPTADDLDAKRLLEPQFDFDRTALPPLDIAKMLASAYFEIGQTITEFVRQDWIDRKIDDLYDHSYTSDVSDAAWICSVLVVLAIGAQYSHSAVTKEDGSSNAPHVLLDRDDGMLVAKKLYRAAMDVVPHVLEVPSVESAQAWLLLGHFALGCNPEVARTYFELCISIGNRCQSEGCHYRIDPDDERRSHLIEVADIWCRYLSAFNTSGVMPQPDASLSLKSFDQALTQKGDLLPQQVVRSLSDWLDGFAAQINELLPHVGGKYVSKIRDLIETKKSYKMWWSTIPSSDKPVLQLDRTSSHLHLLYYLNLVFLGRSFVFASMRLPYHKGFVADPHTPGANLVEEAEYAAYGIIDICSTLDQSELFSTFNYVEYTSCYTAMAFMVTQGLGYRCHLFRHKLETGMCLLRKLAPSREWSELETLDRRIKELIATAANSDITQIRAETVLSYASLRQWLRSSTKRRSNHSANGSATAMESIRPNDVDWSVLELSGCDFPDFLPDDSISWPEFEWLSSMACN